MNGANKAMKNKPYTYEVIEWVNRQKTGKMIPKTVEAYTMFDVNKTVMRCLVKNMAMFGLGLYIYAGEDLPEAPAPELITQEQVLELVKLIAEAKTNMNALLTNLNWGISKLEDIQLASFESVKQTLEAKIKRDGEVK